MTEGFDYFHCFNWSMTMENVDSGLWTTGLGLRSPLIEETKCFSTNQLMISTPPRRYS